MQVNPVLSGAKQPNICHTQWKAESCFLSPKRMLQKPRAVFPVFWSHFESWSRIEEKKVSLKFFLSFWIVCWCTCTWSVPKYECKKFNSRYSVSNCFLTPSVCWKWTLRQFGARGNIWKFSRVAHLFGAIEQLHPTEWTAVLTMKLFLHFFQPIPAFLFLQFDSILLEKVCPYLGEVFFACLLLGTNILGCSLHDKQQVKFVECNGFFFCRKFGRLDIWDFCSSYRPKSPQARTILTEPFASRSFQKSWDIFGLEKMRSNHPHPQGQTSDSWAKLPSPKFWIRTNWIRSPGL